MLRLQDKPTKPEPADTPTIRVMVIGDPEHTAPYSTLISASYDMLDALIAVQECHTCDGCVDIVGKAILKATDSTRLESVDGRVRWSSP